MPYSDPIKAREYHKEHNKKWYQRAKNRNTLTCLNCGALFKSRYSFQKYCSIRCSGESRKSVFICVFCKKRFYAPPSKKRKYCSRTCMNKDPKQKKRMSLMGKSWKNKHKPKEQCLKMSKSQLGEKNHQWKGGITPKYRLIRNLKWYKDWRRSVFERDNYTCQKCGEKGGILNADHYPVSFRDALKADNQEILKDVSNGRTLCVECHKKEHTLIPMQNEKKPTLKTPS